MIFPPLWAEKTEIALLVERLEHIWQLMGASASFIERKTSNLTPQSWQMYS